MNFTRPRLGIFMAMLAVLVASALWIIPTDNRMPTVPGPTPVAPREPACFELSYRDSLQAEILPRHVTLSPEMYLAIAPELVWYHATTDGGDMWQASPTWAFAGLDSIDLQAHHQTWLRFPRQGGTGRALPFVNSGVLVALLFDRIVPFPLEATPKACGTSAH